MMKVLQITKSFLPDTRGGVEEVVRQLSMGLQDYDITADVLTVSPHSHEELVIDDIHIHQCQRSFAWHSTPFSWQLFKNFSKLIEPYDILHYHYPWPFMDLCHLFHKPHQKTVLTYHADAVSNNRMVEKGYQKLTDKFFSNIDIIVPDSPQLMHSSQTLHGFRQKCHPIMLGIDAEAYPKVDEKNLAAWRNKFPRKFALFIGVLRHYKGLTYLIEAAGHISHDIVIAGDGPEREALVQLVQEHGLTNVHFTGFVSEEDKVSLLQLCDLVVLPSHLPAEAFGIALLEGAMFKKPLISTELGTATSYINLDGETGYVVPPADPAALAKALTRLFNSEALSSKLGNAAYTNFMTYYTSKTFVKNYYDVYTELLLLKTKN